MHGRSDWSPGNWKGRHSGSPLSRVVDDGDNLHVLPIVTHGSTANFEGLLYLKGVDLAIINTDTLEVFKAKISDIPSPPR